MTKTTYVHCTLVILPIPFFFFFDYWTTQSWDQPSLQSSQSMYLFFLDKCSLTCKFILACPRSPFPPQCRLSSYISHPSEQYPHLPNHPSRHLGVILESSFYLHFSHSTHHSRVVDWLSSSSLKTILSSSFPTLLIWSSLSMTCWDFYNLWYSSYLKFPSPYNQVTAYLNISVPALSFCWAVLPL